ncbi:MAG: hypothetical protein JST68_09195 [Bacteroidetes bacterium]|nr:hypothetical protein [Bacteroidota bacterium]
MHRLLHGLLLISLLLVGRLQAQPYLFTRIGTRNGLVTNSVLSLQQDAKGFIWIATSNGIQRYDGNRFLLFQHRGDDPKSLPNNVIKQLLLDKQGRLWVLCEANKIGYIDLSDLQYHAVTALVSEDHLNKGLGKLYTDKAGHIFLFVASRVSLTYDEKMHMMVAGLPFPTPQRWIPKMMFQDSLSNYWLASDSGLFKYNLQRQTLSYRGHNEDKDPIITHYASYTNVGYPFLDHSGRFWLQYWALGGPAPNYFSFDLRTGKTVDWNLSIGRAVKGSYAEMNLIAEQSDGAIWFGGINMLLVLRPGGKDFEPIQPNTHGEFNIYFDVVQQWIEDREHNIWLATDRGLYWFNPGAQLFHSIPNRLPNRDSVYTTEISAVRQIDNGDIVVATWGGGLFAYDSSFRPVDRWYINQIKHLGQEDEMSWCLHQRPNGDIWHGHQHGLLYISHWATHTTERLELPVFGHSTIRQIVEDRKGNLWLGTHRGNLIRWEARTNKFTQMDSLISTIQRLYVDRQGDIWVCTQKEGIFHIRPDDGQIISHYTMADAEGYRLSGVGATDILQYSDSLYIIATYNLDILNIKTGRIRSDTSITGELFGGATNVIKDRKGYLWISNTEGIYRLNFRNQHRSIFTEADGVGSNAFNMGTSYELKDGRIVFGTVHECIVFQPSEIRSIVRTPDDIEITGLTVQNKSLSVDSIERRGGLELPYGANSVRIEFSALTYQDINGISYQLQGADKDWVEATSNDAVYNYLPPGHYTFRIRGINAENMVSRHTRELSITVKGPFWRSWWFLSLVLLLGATALYLLDRIRMQRKEAVEKMRSDISGNLHEEVNKALQNINVLSEIARIKAEKDPEQSINYINEIHHKSHNMIIAMDDMLWSIDPVNDNMAKTIDRMQEFAEALNHRHGVRIRLQAAESLRALHPDMKIRHELLLIYKLILRMLVEEHNAPETLVQLEQERGMLQLNIFSAGVRLNLRNGRSTRLLEEARSRSSSIRGDLDWQSDEKGMTILFICPSTF